MNAKKMFVNWLRVNDPFVYQLGVERYKLLKNKDDGGLGVINAGFFNSLIDTVKNVAPQVLNYNQQKKLLDIQVNRARNNLPPLKADDYVPSVRVSPEITVETEQAAKRIARDSIKAGFGSAQPVMLAGAALIGVLLLTRKRR